MTDFAKRRWANIAAGALLLFIIARWFRLVDLYSVNILFLDQWDFMEGLFSDHGLWELFTWQHGPHRQGVGFFLTRVVAELSSWDTRVESYVIGSVVCVAGLCAFLIKLRACGRYQPVDIFIGLLFLSPLYAGLWANTPNLSHGSVPLLLITLFGLSWLSKSLLLRYTLAVLLNFMAIYTGFGIFLGLITPLLFLSEAVLALGKNDRRRLWLAIVFGLVAVLSLASFFIDYTFKSAAPGFIFPHPYPFIYVKYIFVNFSAFCGVRGAWPVSYLCGGFIVLVMGLVVAAAAASLWRNRQGADNKQAGVQQILIVLILFSLLFSLNLAFGRVFLGLETARSSRYLPYLVPGFFAIYLFAVTRRLNLTTPLSVCLVLFFATTFSLGTTERQRFENYSTGRTKWKKNYLKTENILLSEHLSRFPIHPNATATQLQRKLKYLKKNKLNLYKE
ncbi:MAG: hypothetical protein ABFS19_07555 [Thermodesulfobacteriota bacterium]